MLGMLIILPPSETKATGGSGAPLNVEELFLAGPLTGSMTSATADVTAVRARLTTGLAQSAAKTPKQAQKLIGLKDSQVSELEHNARVLDSPTMPAIERYTGVAYDALDVTGERTGVPLDSAARQRLAIGSALFGVVGAEDQIPYYRLSAGSKVKVRGIGQPVTVRSQWAKVLTPALQDWQAVQPAADNAIIDLRSGGYLNLGPVPGALKLRVESLYPDGSRKVVSHFNKHFKGLVARELALAGVSIPAENAAAAFCDVVAGVPSFIDANFSTEILDAENVTLIVPAE